MAVCDDADRIGRDNGALHPDYYFCDHFEQKLSGYIVMRNLSGYYAYSNDYQYASRHADAQAQSGVC